MRPRRYVVVGPSCTVFPCYRTYVHMSLKWTPCAILSDFTASDSMALVSFQTPCFINAHLSADCAMVNANIMDHVSLSPSTLVRTPKLPNTSSLAHVSYNSPPPLIPFNQQDAHRACVMSRRVCRHPVCLRRHQAIGQTAKHRKHGADVSRTTLVKHSLVLIRHGRCKYGHS